jgi:2-phospho-L-lactate/phosphoenolpyruvate guanylyltransferase
LDRRDARTVIAIVPMKPFVEAKGRLAEELTPQARGELARGLFERTLRVLRHARGVGRIVAVSRDAGVLKIARKGRAWAIYETGFGLNEALEQATRVLKANGAQIAMIVPADLPGLQESDIEGMIELGWPPPSVVVAPDRRDHGTNALLVNPTGLISYAFGEMSFVEHQRLAERAGARVEIYRSENVAFDLDLPEDARALRKWNSGR